MKLLADIVDTATSSDMFKTLVGALKTAGLVDTLKGPGPLTIFAPTDSAFAKLPKAELVALLNDQAKLKETLTFHVVSGKIMAADMVQHECLKALNGGELRIDSKRWHMHRSLKVNGAYIFRLDLVVDNGVYHAIDTVLIPNMMAFGEQCK